MATNKIDMSLDDIIKLTNVRRGGRGGRLRGRGVGRGNRRGTTAGFRGRGFRTRGASGGVLRGGVQKRGRGFRGFQTRGRASAGWQRGGRASFQARFQQRSNMGAGDNAGSGGGISKLLISNLDFGVNDADIKELFSEFGAMRRAAVHYDRSGRSLGSAEVIYSMRAAGFRAQQQYNNVPLDGRPMKIQLVGGPETVSQSTTATISPRGGFGRGAGRGGGRGRMRGFGRRGRGGRGGASSRPTKDELDAQLDAYNAKMDTL